VISIVEIGYVRRSEIYDAREHAIGLIKSEAAEIGADDVLGIKTHIHESMSIPSSTGAEREEVDSPTS
jgi:uncharacterized protein YbjQ (UPF0145 family)